MNEENNISELAKLFIELDKVNQEILKLRRKRHKIVKRIEELT